LEKALSCRAESTICLGKLHFFIFCLEPLTLARKLAEKGGPSRLRKPWPEKDGGDFERRLTPKLSKITKRSDLQIARTLLRVITYVNTNFCIPMMEKMHTEAGTTLTQKKMGRNAFLVG
jgi:hypothetical protein